MFCIQSTLTILAAGLLTAASAHAVPVTVDLTEARALPGKLYISIQTEDQYMSETGQGGIIEDVATSGPRVTYDIDAPGDYAISLWHDLDADGEFSMDERYQLIDAWGASGNAERNARPTFDDVAVSVTADGAFIPVTMFYPE